MNASKISQAAVLHRTPLINFLGKRILPQQIDHTSRAHPQAPSNVLPTSFAAYRQSAQQHGPLASQSARRTPTTIAAGPGEFFDRNELPKRFWRMTVSKEEMELIESGGAAAFA